MTVHCPKCNAPRKSSPCWKCGATCTVPASGWTYPRLPNVKRIRALAREVGYAVGVHGSQERDLDLIAVPWVDSAVTAPALAEHIAAGINGRVVDAESKPLGRWACNIQIDGWYKLIDLSVTPALREPIPMNRNGKGDAA